MKKFDFVIFDCDGVLVDSEVIANQVVAEVKTELGFPTTTEEQISKFVGLGLSSPLMQEEIQRLPSQYWELVDQRCELAYRQKLKAISGAQEVLEKLPIPKCVASSSEPAWLDLKLSLTKLKTHFDQAIFHGRMVNKCKPAPDLFLYAIQKMRWQQLHGLVIEDSVAGVTAGAAAGLTVCGFVGGSHIFAGHTERLLKAGADFVISDLKKILLMT